MYTTYGQTNQLYKDRTVALSESAYAGQEKIKQDAEMQQTLLKTWLDLQEEDDVHKNGIKRLELEKKILSQIFSYKNKISNGGGHSILSITLGNRNGNIPSNSNFGDDMIEKIAARERAVSIILPLVVQYNGTLLNYGTYGGRSCHSRMTLHVYFPTNKALVVSLAGRNKTARKMSNFQRKKNNIKIAIEQAKDALHRKFDFFYENDCVGVARVAAIDVLTFFSLLF